MSIADPGARLRDDARHGCSMNFEQAGDFGGRLASGRHGLDDFLLLLGGDFRLSPGNASLGACFEQAGARALADHLALEFSEGAEHLHQHATGGAGCIDRLRQRSEFRAGGADPFEDGQKVFERAGQAVELPDDERVAGAELVEHLVQFGTLPPSAGRRFLEQPGASSVLERANLGRGFLGVGFGDASVAEEHICRFFLLPITCIWQQN